MPWFIVHEKIKFHSTCYNLNGARIIVKDMSDQILTLVD